MASLRNPATACTRLLISRSDRGTVSRLRTASPVRWNRDTHLCVCREVGSAHQAYQTHTTARTSQEDDHKQKKKLSYTDILKEQLKNVEKMKDGIVNTFSNASDATTAVPSRMIDTFHKNLSVVAHMRNRVMNDISAFTEAMSSQASELRRLERKLKQKVKLTNSSAQSDANDKQSFQEFTQDTNQSIASFYDTSIATDAKVQSGTEEPSVIDEVAQHKVKKGTNKGSKTEQIKKKFLVKEDFVSKSGVEYRTRALVHAIKLASSTASKCTRTEDLCKHLLKHPESRNIAAKEKVLGCVLRFEKSSDKALQAVAREALALVGYIGPVKGQGIRLLAIDGGGTRGLVAIECMKRLEQLCGKNLNEMFDYVCGVSTGALIATLTFLHRVPLDECEVLYKEFSRKMFTRNKLLGTGKLMWNHAFYDEEIWEEILKNEIGYKKMIEFSRKPGTVKMSALSCLMNTPRMKMYFFRNYNLPPGVYTDYLGSCNHTMWEVIRASTAAPGYFESFIMDDLVHQDGGLMANNGTALAIHESKLLWPDVPFQCVVSLGTGQHLPSTEYSSTKLALKDKVMKIVDSATDTEAVHMTLQDLLPQSTYFRLNPYLSENVMLDEIRDEKFDLMTQDTRMYLRKNEVKVNKAVNQLMRERRPDQKLADSVKYMKDSYL